MPNQEKDDLYVAPKTTTTSTTSRLRAAYSRRRRRYSRSYRGAPAVPRLYKDVFGRGQFSLQGGLEGAQALTREQAARGESYELAADRYGTRDQMPQPGQYDQARILARTPAWRAAQGRLEAADFHYNRALYAWRDRLQQQANRTVGMPHPGLYANYPVTPAPVVPPPATGGYGGYGYSSGGGGGGGSGFSDFFSGYGLVNWRV